MIVLCHPFERSFCRAICDALREGFRDGSVSGPTVHDLYVERVDPLLTGAEIARRFSLDDQIQAHTDEVTKAEWLVFVHPDWWSGPPALLKGWIERVFRPGVAYDWEGPEFEEKHHVPLLAGKRCAVFVTTDREADRPPAPIEGFWHDVAEYSGLALEKFTLYSDLRRSGHRQRRTWLAAATAWARGIRE